MKHEEYILYPYSLAILKAFSTSKLAASTANPGEIKI